MGALDEQLAHQKTTGLIYLLLTVIVALFGIIFLALWRKQ
jgi:hypothetical protein